METIILAIMLLTELQLWEANRRVERLENQIRLLSSEYVTGELRREFARIEANRTRP